MGSFKRAKVPCYPNGKLGHVLSRNVIFLFVFVYILASGEMKEENLDALCVNLDILVIFLNEKAISLIYSMEYWRNW